MYLKSTVRTTGFQMLTIVLRQVSDWSEGLIICILLLYSTLFLPVVALDTILAHITNISVDGVQGFGPHFVAVDRPVQIACRWINGNPPTEVHLVGSHGEVLSRTDASEEVIYTFPHIRCMHAGIIQCKVNDSNENMSALLLPECPPHFVKTAPEIVKTFLGQSGYHFFPFRSHTTNITTCLLSRNQTQSNSTDDKVENLENTFTCSLEMPGQDLISAIRNLSDTWSYRPGEKCWCSAYGRPPDMNFVVFISNLSQLEEGVWNVVAFNNIGSDYFLINVSLVRYARVIHLSLVPVKGHEGQGRNQTAIVVCSWENGNPPTKVLLTMNGAVLNSSSESGNMSYMLSRDVCESHCVIRCAAGGSIKYTTVAFLPKYFGINLWTSFVTILMVVFPVMVFVAVVVGVCATICPRRLSVQKGFDLDDLNYNRCRPGHEPIQMRQYITSPVPDVFSRPRQSYASRMMLENSCQVTE